MKKELAKIVSDVLNKTVSRTNDVSTLKVFLGTIDIPSDKKQPEQK
ncbi:hypothetical protein [Paenibacillus sp. OV219]|nr:hypothetical protein [Paenibacillus sp. OV219]SEN59198.1 hypothetical protein SAMN05518847_103278 [Paenibacillus sp. OV219]